MGRGRFIVLEGIDGSGTTSQARALTQVLETRGHSVLRTYEPSQGSIGQLIRNALRAAPTVGDGATLDPAAMALLFAADRLDHIAREVEPALAQGKVVVCDRYVLSSWAYQSIECDLAWVKEINRRAPVPDLTVFLEISVATAVARVRSRRGPAEIYDAEARQRAIADRYELLLADPPGKVVRIDGSAELDAVTEAVVVAFDSL